MIKNDVKDREAIHTAVARGMKELTGATDAVEAWRSFFEPGDVVGVKMNPVGNPLANSSSELMLEVIDGLQAAGVKTKDIIVFERYRDEFIGAKMHEAVPDGIAWTGLGIAYNGKQVDIKGDDEKTGNLDRITGYDPDEFMVDGAGHGRARSEGRPDPALAPRPARHPAGQQDRAPARAQGPRLGRRHRGAQEHEPRAGQQRLPLARHARYQRLQPVHPAGRQPPDHPPQVRPADHGRDQGGLPGRPRRVEAGMDLGEQRAASSPPTPWRWTTSPGGMSTPSARRRACRRSAPAASWASTR